MLDLIVKWTFVSFLGSVTVAVVIGLFICLFDVIIGCFGNFIDNRIKAQEWWIKHLTREEIKENEAHNRRK